MSTPAHLISGLAPDPVCPTCHGRGTIWDWLGGWQVCPECGGKGYVQPKYTRVPFDYAFSDLLSGVGAGAGPQTTSIQIAEDAPFEQTHWIVVDNGSGQRFTIQIQDLSTGWQFSSQGVNDLNFARSAKFSFPLLVPYVWHPLAEAQLTIENIAPEVSENNVQVILRGFKLFPPDYYAQQLAQLQGSAGAAPGGAQT